MEGQWVEGRPQWWWKYVFPSVVGGSGWPEEHMGHGVPWLPAGGPFPEPWRRLGPHPEPWRTSVVGSIISAVSIKEVAQRMREGDLGAQLSAHSDRTISEVIDDYCTPPWRWPWPWPGPPPWVLEVVEELALVANSLQEGSMREELLGVAGRMMERAASETGSG